MSASQKKACFRYVTDGGVLIEGITITRVGRIEELSQQDYKGKRVNVHIKDTRGNLIESKIDLGVHKYMKIEQEEYCLQKRLITKRIHTNKRGNNT